MRKQAESPYVGPRLWAKIPQRRYACFYPMSKRRGEVQNWYMLGFDARAKMMSEHGVVGRSYHGRVTQVISGSIGYDDFEWGVDLYADDPLVFKKLIYEMRFDEASARYAEFGPFWSGIQFSSDELAAFLDGDAIPQLNAPAP
jgi:hydrogen peroxide-dependent heme synthase